MKNTPIKGTRFKTFHCARCFHAFIEVECNELNMDSKVNSVIEVLSKHPCPECKQPLDQIEVQDHMIVLKKWPNKEPKP